MKPPKMDQLTSWAQKNLLPFLKNKFKCRKRKSTGDDEESGCFCCLGPIAVAIIVLVAVITVALISMVAYFRPWAMKDFQELATNFQCSFDKMDIPFIKWKSGPQECENYTSVSIEGTEDGESNPLVDSPDKYRFDYDEISVTGVSELEQTTTTTSTTTTTEQPCKNKPDPAKSGLPGNVTKVHRRRVYYYEVDKTRLTANPAWNDDDFDKYCRENLLGRLPEPRDKEEYDYIWENTHDARILLVSHPYGYLLGYKHKKDNATDSSKIERSNFKSRTDGSTIPDELVWVSGPPVLDDGQHCVRGAVRQNSGIHRFYCEVATSMLVCEILCE